MPRGARLALLCTSIWIILTVGHSADTWIQLARLAVYSIGMPLIIWGSAYLASKVQSSVLPLFAVPMTLGVGVSFANTAGRPIGDLSFVGMVIASALTAAALVRSVGSRRNVTEIFVIATIGFSVVPIYYECTRPGTMLVGPHKTPVPLYLGPHFDLLNALMVVILASPFGLAMAMQFRRPRSGDGTMSLK